MKPTAFILATLLMAAVSVGALPVKGFSSEDEQLRKHYNEYISKSISKNRSKANLQTSKSENLRSRGARCEQKVVFLTIHRNTLVDEMIKKQVGTKSYKIDHYLNSRFHEMER